MIPVVNIPPLKVIGGTTKQGNNRKHLGILGPRNIGGNGPISGCNIRGGLDRYWN